MDDSQKNRTDINVSTNIIQDETLSEETKKLGYAKMYTSHLSRRLVVTLEILGDNNENRKVFDPNYAIFRCSKAKVIEIKDMFEDCEFDECRKMGAIKIPYKVGDIIEDENYEDGDEADSDSTIRYFKTYEAAFWYAPYEIRNMCRVLFGFYCRKNGNNESNENIKNFTMSYKQFYFKSGRKKAEQNVKMVFDEDTLELLPTARGEWTEWYPNGKVKSRNNYDP